MVLIEGKVQVTRFESFVAVFFQLIGNLNDLWTLEILLLIFREIFIGVSRAVNSFFSRLRSVIARQLTAVYESRLGNIIRIVTTPSRHTSNNYIMYGFVALCFITLNLTDNALSIQYFAKNNMFPIEMGCGHGGHEELGSICSCRKISRSAL